MGFLIAVICIGALSVIFAIQGDFDAFGGGMVIAACLVVCWIVWKKRKSHKIEVRKNNIPLAPNNIYPNQAPSVQPVIQNIPQVPKNTIPHKTENHHVVGTSFRQLELESLGQENPVYEYSKKELIDEGYEDEKIYYYDFFPNTVELVEEPDNEHDPNAVKVVVDGVHIGYIKAGSCSHIKKLLHTDSIVKTDVEIRGGKYKYLYCEYDDEKEKDVYTLEQGVSEYYATVTIKYISK